eukprot:NODE_1301_length_1198_cov_80.107050_g1070_i0.p1 GENE.NODE_1301_length_1198_cov_80.107050_g1070_i0~~NODE_1301_length_1198_cov_80.107050_g1070_i0.p1  ORF type:complete len:223 (-),score=50.10 NODE_1301_length_1198_cov_80.107050_g1070_i0:146-814(-)
MEKRSHSALVGGGLAGLKAWIVQEPLPPQHADAIWAEMDTQHLRSRLMAQLEECIRFLATIGGGHASDVDGNTLLQTYVLDTLLVPSGLWERSSTPSVAQHVHLRHLQSLYVYLEEKEHGDAAERAGIAYHEPLPEGLKAELVLAAGSMDLRYLVPTVKDFVAEQLTSGSWEPSSSLKQYLIFFDLDLEIEDWFRDFPDGLELRHTVEVCRLLDALKGGNVL